MGKVKGVCAVCRVDADAGHFHTASAAAWERKHEKEQAERRRAESEPPTIGL